MIPLVDLKAQHLPLKESLLAVLETAIATGEFIEGAVLSDFERAFAQYVGTSEAIGVASGTDAICLALQALGVGPGSTVVTSPFTFVATVEAILHTGASVEFVDVDPTTGLIDPQRLCDHLKHRCSTTVSGAPIRAIVPVHLYGNCADMSAICELARRYELCVVEDAAQALGASLGDTKAGAIADAAAFSCYPTKTLGALGDAGIITTSSSNFTLWRPNDARC